MSKQLPADGSLSRGSQNNTRAVAGAQRKTETERNVGCIAVPSSDVGARPWGADRRAGQRRRRDRAAAEWTLFADLPECVPVLPPELAALEAHLGAAIDAILARKSTPAKGCR